jgi:hypothetical protein
VDAFVHQHGVIEARTNYQVVAIMGPQSSGKSTLMNHVVRNCLLFRPDHPSSVHVVSAVDHALQLVLLLTVSRLHIHMVNSILLWVIIRLHSCFVTRDCIPVSLSALRLFQVPLQFGTGFQEMDAMTGRQQTTKGVWMAKSPKVDDVCTLIMDLEGSDGRERGEDDTNFERQSALFALAVADVLLINVWCHDIGREQGSGKPLMKTIFQVRSSTINSSDLQDSLSWQMQLGCST